MKPPETSLNQRISIQTIYHSSDAYNGTSLTVKAVLLITSMAGTKVKFIMGKLPENHVAQKSSRCQYY